VGIHRREDQKRGQVNKSTVMLVEAWEDTAGRNRAGDGVPYSSRSAAEVEVVCIIPHLVGMEGSPFSDRTVPQLLKGVSRLDPLRRRLGTDCLLLLLLIGYFLHSVVLEPNTIEPSGARLFARRLQRVVNHVYPLRGPPSARNGSDDWQAAGRSVTFTSGGRAWCSSMHWCGGRSPAGPSVSLNSGISPMRLCRLATPRRSSRCARVANVRLYRAWAAGSRAQEMRQP